MIECDIFRGGKTYSDLSYIFPGVKTPNLQDLRPWKRQWRFHRWESWEAGTLRPSKTWYRMGRKLSWPSSDSCFKARPGSHAYTNVATVNFPAGGLNPFWPLSAYGYFTCRVFRYLRLLDYKSAAPLHFYPTKSGRKWETAYIGQPKVYSVMFLCGEWGDQEGADYVEVVLALFWAVWNRTSATLISLYPRL